MFKIGDVVELKSGSEKMTVTEIQQPPDGHVVCSWMDKGGRSQVNAWPADALRLASGPSAPSYRLAATRKGL
jgi:uncharacterized protein YodC (DUF2158 family)